MTICVRLAILTFLLHLPPCLFGSSSDLADQVQIRFLHLDSEDGLSMNLATALVQDENGFIWIGTQHGLNRYDGYEIVGFRHEDGPSKLPDSTIWALERGPEGKLWIGTGKGLSSFDSTNSTFSNWVLPDWSGSYSVRAICHDNKGVTWIGTSVGLYSIAVTGVVSAVEFNEKFADHKGIGAGVIKAIYCEDAGSIFIGTEGAGLFHQVGDDEFVRFQTLSQYEAELQSAHIRDLVKDELGYLWVATNNRGVYRISLNNLNDVSKIESLPNKVRSLLIDSEGVVWIGSDIGLLNYDRDSETTRLYTHTSTDSSSLINNVVVDLYEDAGGVIWVGTFGGVSRFNSRIAFPNLIAPSLIFPGRVKNQIVTSFAESSDGVLWVGTYSGLLRYNGDASSFFRARDIGLSDEKVTALAIVNEMLWVGTVSGGINVLDGSTLVSQYSHDPLDSSSLSSNAITDIFVDTESRVWVATYGGGLNLFQDENGYEVVLGKTSGEIGNRSVSLAEDSQGNIWVATDGTGLIVYNHASRNIKAFRSFDQSPQSLQSDHLVSLKVMNDGIWVGSLEDGLSFLDFASGRFNPLVPELSKGPVYSILEDSTGDLWIGGDRGISHISKGTLQFSQYDSSHGLQRGDFTAGARILLRSGEMAFGGANGFNILNPAENFRNDYSPEIALTSYSLNHKFFVPSNNLEEKLLALAYPIYLMSFSFSALDYTYPEKNQYRYRLEGFDRDWIENGANRRITYTNLDPGSYLLTVQGSNNDGVWNREGLSLPIKVLPPAWATWWAYTLYVFLAVFLFYQLMMVNSRKHHRRAEQRFSRRMAAYVSSFNFTDEAILNADERGVVVFSNDATDAVLGRSIAEVNGFSLFEVLFQKREDRERAEAQLARESTFHQTLSLQKSNGESGSIHVAIKKVRPQSDLKDEYVVVVRDVTENQRKISSLEREIKGLEDRVQDHTLKTNELLEEKAAWDRDSENERSARDSQLFDLYERTNTSLQMLGSLFGVQANKVADSELKKLLAENRQRIDAVSLVFESIHQSASTNLVDMSIYCDSLSSSIYRRNAPDLVEVKLHLEIEAIKLGLGQAVPCGLLINELVTNSLVHAFSDRGFGTGNLTIKMYSSGNDCVLQVSDDGRGLPESTDLQAAGGMGLEIASTLAEQLGGSMRLLGGIGTTIEIRFPLSR